MFSLAYDTLLAVTVEEDSTCSDVILIRKEGFFFVEMHYKYCQRNVLTCGADPAEVVPVQTQIHCW